MARKAKPKRPRKSRSPQPSRRRARKVAVTPKKPKRTRKRLRPDPRIELAVREMNRGRSLTATARSLHLSPKSLQRILKHHGLAKRKGNRWVTKDHRLRRVLVISGGRIRKAVVRGYDDASLAGKHYEAAGSFVRTNDFKLLERFEGHAVRAANGRRYFLETDPNALHRIAAMDSPLFHEIYEITSNS